MSFKDQIKLSLINELNADTFVMDIVTRFQQAIRDSIANPGIEEYVIFRMSETEPLTDNQIAKVKMACKVHIGVPLDVSMWEIIVRMELFLA